MQHLHLIAMLCVLLQLSRAQKVDVLARAEDPGDLSTWDEAEKNENFVGKLEEEGELEQPNEASTYETDLDPRERLDMEADYNWQHTLKDTMSEEAIRAAVLKDIRPEVEGGDGNAWGQPDYSEKQFERDAQEDDAYKAYRERQRKLEEQSSQIDNDKEEEALPVIPGLTGVELIAFNPEYANAEVLDKIIDWSYDQVATISRYRDTYIHAEDLYNFLLKTLNPLDEDIDAEDEQILTDAVTELRRQQGLLGDEQIVYRGFIARGMPLRFLQSLAHEMHQTVQTRRLQASAGREEL